MVVLASLGDPRRSLCWVAPVAADSELATEDPLALDYISQQIGLRLSPALTTRSSRAQAFAMAGDRRLRLAGLPARGAALSQPAAAR